MTDQTQSPLPLTVSLEYLYHYRCGHCQQWWTISDVPPTIPSTVGCPACLQLNTVTGMEAHLVEPDAIKRQS